MQADPLPNQDVTLTTLQGYRAMLHFLEGYYERAPSDELAILLGGLSLNNDGAPMDPAAWSDWIGSVKSVRESSG